MITAGQQRAICRIWVNDTKSRGTGFLISSDAVLTAAHVVKKSEDDWKQPSTKDITLRFIASDGQPFNVMGRVEQFDAKLDWALVRLLPATTMPHAAPFRALQLPAENALKWATYGFSKTAEDAGKMGLPYSGDVQTLGLDRIQVRLSGNDLVAGLSGSPCLVDGYVVGVIVSSTDKTKPANSLDVLPIERISSTDLKLLPREAPYASHVLTYIGPFEPELRQVAVKLGVTHSEEDAAVFAEGRLAKRCAITMMSGVDPTVQVLLGIKRRFRDHWPNAHRLAEELLRLAGRVWIDPEAVRLLAESLASGTQPIALNTDRTPLLEDYLHRAGCLTDPVPGRFDVLLPIDAVASSDDELLAAFNATIEAHPQISQFGATALEALENYPHEDFPIVACFAAVPPLSAFNAIRGAGAGYARVRMVFLVGSTSPDKLATEYPSAVVIKPAPRPEAVTDALKALEAGLKRLFLAFPELKKKSNDVLQQAI